jgi:hypothetical protein
LTSVTIPVSVTNIGEEAFTFCTNLTSVTIPVNVASIGDFAFAYTGLSSVTIPDSVTNIGVSAFSDCPNLTSIRVDAGNPDYSSVNRVLFDKSQSALIEYPGGLDGDYTIPASVTTIGDDAFEDCSRLASVTIPALVTNIGQYAFDGCTSLASVTIPNGVTNIGSDAFAGCLMLAEVYFEGNAPSADCSVFQGDHIVVYYLPGATGWGSTFACSPAADEYSYTTNAGAIAINRYSGPGGAVTIPTFINGLPVNSIGTNSFAGANLTSVTIPSRVTSIGGAAFYECYTLTNVEIPASVIAVGVEAFAFCTNLTAVMIPGSVTSMGESAFADCASLTSITIPGSVANIGFESFYQCYSLTNATIGDGVTNIGENAFEYCTNLLAAFFEGNAPSADCTVFDYDDALTVFHLPGTTGWGSTFACVPTAVWILGSLQVTITPAAAITAGAQWQVDGGTWQTSGATVANVSPGNHTVDFSAISGWITPSSQTVSVSANSTASATGAYVPLPQMSFSYTTNGDAATIVSYFGSGGAVAIPAAVNGLPVTSIGANAFYKITNLTSITIPGSVTSMGEGAFAECASLTRVYFTGNAPSADSTVLSGDTNATVYYLLETAGWSRSLFGYPYGPPVVLWNPLGPTGDARFGVQTNQFEISFTGPVNLSIVVEACTNLATPIWTPLQTDILTNGSVYFSEPLQTNTPGRYYRVSAP